MPSLRHNKKGGHIRTGFRPSQVHQHPEQQRIKPSAREIFPVVQERVHESRPRMVVEHPHLKDAKGKPLKVVEFGPPAFRNVIEDGRWV